jgi:hypothetical protein
MKKNTFLCICLILCAAHLADAVDGIAISYHSSRTDPSGLHSGSIVRHIIRGDTVSQSTVVYDIAGARSVRLRPDGTRIAFIRATDGAICVMGIDGGAVDSLTTVSPDALLDWADTSGIYFTEMFNHITLRRMTIGTKVSEPVGWFAVGAVGLSVGGSPDSLHGIVVLDYYGGHYQVSTFDYRVFFANTYIGCAGFVSPSGDLYAVGACESDTSSYRKSLSVYTWTGDTAGTIFSPQNEFFSRGGWSANSDDWFVANVGMDRELLLYHDMAILARDTTTVIRVTRNTAGNFDEACDFWAGNPDTAMAISSANPISAKQGRFFSGSLHDGSWLRGIDAAVYTPQGRFAGIRNDNKSLPKAAGVYIYENSRDKTITRRVKKN